MKFHRSWYPCIAGAMMSVWFFPTDAAAWVGTGKSCPKAMIGKTYPCVRFGKAQTCKCFPPGTFTGRSVIREAPKSKPANRTPSQRKSIGSYRAEPAHDAPPKREAPASARKNPPSKPSEKSPTKLGTTSPTPAPAAAPATTPAPEPSRPQFAKKDIAAGSMEVPVPRLGASAWSKSFPNEKAVAALHLTQQGYDKLRQQKPRAADWLGDKAKEKGKEKAIDTFIEHLPFSDMLKQQIAAKREMVERYKELYEDKKKNQTEYVTGFFNVAHDWVACEASGRIGCDKEAGAKLDRVRDKYANREGERWQSWMKSDSR